MTLWTAMTASLREQPDEPRKCLRCPVQDVREPKGSLSEGSDHVSKTQGCWARGTLTSHLSHGASTKAPSACAKGTWTRDLPQSAGARGTWTKDLPQSACERGAWTRDLPQSACARGTWTRDLPQSTGARGTWTRDLPQRPSPLEPRLSCPLRTRGALLPRAPNQT
jgi:hypothetical protein